MMTPDQEQIHQLLQQRPSSLLELAERLTPTVYAALQQAVELRKFADGTRLTGAQLENCLQLVILYESRHVPAHERVGYDIPTSCQKGQGKQAERQPGVQQWLGEKKA